MWIQVLLIAVSGVAGVMADESRTALIASGCVAGAVLIVAIAVGVGYFVIRHFHRKEKKLLSRYDNSDPVTGEFYPPDKVPSHSNSALDLIADSRREQRSLGAKAFTQHAANTRHRPPVAFYTVRTDPRMVPELPGVMHMGPPMYARPPPVGRPVIFLDRNGPHRHLRTSEDFMYPNNGTMLYYAANGDMMVPSGRESNEMPRRNRTSREPRRVRRDTSPSKSRSRSRDTEISRSHHSSSNETTILANPGDIILRTKDDSGLRATEQKRVDNNITIENHIVHIDSEASNIHDHATFTETREIVRDKISHVSNEGNFSVTKATIYPSAITATSYIQNVVKKEEGRTFTGFEEDPLPSPQQDYSTDSLLNSASTEMHRVLANGNSSVMSPFLDQVAERLEFQETTVTRTIEEFQDPIPSPTQDYPEDTPRSSDTYYKIPEVNRSPMLSRETKESTKSAWVDFPTLVTNRDSFGDSGRFNTGDLSTTTVTSTRFSRSTNNDHEVNRDNIGLVYRQNPSLARPPSPPLMKRSASPLFDVYPPKTSVKSEEAKTFVYQTQPHVLTHTLDRSAFSNDGYISPVSSSPTPPPLHLGNLRRQPPTPPPGLIKHDLKMDVDDIINLRQEPANIDNTVNFRRQQINIDDIVNLRKEPVHIDYTSKQKASREEHTGTGGLPFLGELLGRQRTIDDGPVPSPPAFSTTRSPSPLLASLANSKRGRFEEDLDEDVLRKPSVVHFAREPPEVIYRDSSHEYNMYYDSKSSHDYELETSSPHSLPILSPPPPPPPAPPPPPPAPPLPK